MRHALISLTRWRFSRIGYKQPTKECVYMRFFAPKRKVKLIIILNISQIHFTPDFPFKVAHVKVTHSISLSATMSLRPSPILSPQQEHLL